MKIKDLIENIKYQFKEINIDEINESIIKDYSKDGRYKEAININQGLTNDEKKFVEKYFKKNKAKILVLGCGGGRECVFLRKKGFEIIGIDIVPSLIEFAKNYFKKNKLKGKFYCRDISDLSLFEDESFDYVVMFKSVIGHVKKRIETFLEIKRVLKKDGILIFTTYYRYSYFKRAFLLFFLDLFKIIYGLFTKKKLEKSSWITKKNCYVHMPSLRETKKELKKANLKIVEVYYSKEMKYMFFIVKK